MYEPITNFIDSNGFDLGKKLITKDYLLEVYGSILNSIGISPTPALWAWGSNSAGQLGVTGTLPNRDTPVTTLLGGTNWKSVTSGSSHTASIKTDGTLWVWGNNANGQLAINDISVRVTPVTTILGGTNWKSVSGGNSHTVSIKTDGTLWTWGNNANGQLGINDNVTRSTPVTTLLGGTNWKFVYTGTNGNHIIAIKTDGTLWTWGANGFGQLGVNDNVTRSTPVTTLLGGTNWKSAAASGSNFSVAIKTDGTLWTWGTNAGRLGIDDAPARSTPITTILGGNNWKTVTAGGHIIAIKTNGTLWTWGSNGAGQLGINSTITRSTPVTTILGGTNWKSVSSGSDHTLAIKTDGTLWVWGINSSGQLGINDTTNRDTPITTILGGNNWKSVDGGSVNTTAILSVNYI